MFPAIFLDRDGVIIENRPDYVRSWTDVELFPQAVAALKRLSLSPYRIIVVTNQSAVGRGIMSLEQAQRINQQLVAELEKLQCRIDRIYLCPHPPEVQCVCRKPKPGLILQAAQELTIDLTRSIMIGDAWSDLQAGHAAGIPHVRLVLTGRGKAQQALPKPPDLTNIAIYNTLADALGDVPSA